MKKSAAFITKSLILIQLSIYLIWYLCSNRTMPDLRHYSMKATLLLPINDYSPAVIPTVIEKFTENAIETETSDNKSSKGYTYIHSIHEDSVEERIHNCMEAANLEHETGLISHSQDNARYLHDEFRKVIPLESLSNYSSHCWNVPFSTQWARGNFNGYIGDITFTDEYKNNLHMNVPLVLSYLSKKFPAMKYESDMVCLPNFFLAGFPKCGSTFLYCSIIKMVHMVTQNLHKNYNAATKEPHFWVRASAVKDVYAPKVDNIGKYLLYFLPKLNQVRTPNRNETFFIDGSPNIMFNWPRFSSSEHDLTNYCLIPSVLPNLLPHSKYIVIMRNPIDMVYSAFWFSCTFKIGHIPMDVQLKGPNLFHNRVVAKITLFNECMKDRSVSSIDHTCVLDSKHNYSSCIMKRMHLLDKCVHHITFNLFSPELPKCGRTRIAMGMYFVHIRKWLSVVAKDRFIFLTLEDLAENATQVMSNILNKLELRITSEYMRYSVMAKQSCSTNSQSSVNYKRDHRLQMRADTRTMLDIFYHPFNQQLGDLLNWTIPWIS